MGQSSGHEASGFVASVFELFREAVTDIRHKVVEEGWFGRPTTQDRPPPVEELGWEAQRPSFDELWKPAEPDPSQKPLPDRDGPDMDL